MVSSFVWRLASGELVRDLEDSHLHAGVAELLPEALGRISSDGRTFILVEIDMGRVVGVTNGVTTRPGDSIVYAQRPGRPGLTRFVLNREPEPCRYVRVALTWVDEEYKILTAYIGRASELEPADSMAKFSTSYGFWKDFALLWGFEPVVSCTRQDARADHPEAVTCPHCGQRTLWYAVAACIACSRLGCQYCLVNQANQRTGKIVRWHVRCGYSC
ncbi:hypothetical protein A2348_03100 [Candidatus Uhrbacteria bacterium RIFOXYB12_FULL_58_10]|uniref:Uncharacterized protein n=1 Tax=Candidatus Uhrbacteria bacterium RIFOXYB2_FULL_57_15 TaxID=1802422 RepID=A0A1F7W6F2_9BACT|nr:MAG: hypothetical protein A2348_03100 [Candidatus Uhrbacteria bacterium RIFOXYB12_FULL_58_10]OGL97948.1 MAG: hypothetical protein A2304_05340 [Candidatus Uhrbacteria bacterium RIFOXYB2_FULL_57_15]